MYIHKNRKIHYNIYGTSVCVRVSLAANTHQSSDNRLLYNYVYAQVYILTPTCICTGLYTHPYMYMHRFIYSPLHVYAQVYILTPTCICTSLYTHPTCVGTGLYSHNVYLIIG